MTEQEPLGKQLSMVVRVHTILIDHALEPYDLSHGQLFLLLALYNQEGIYQSTLSKLYRLDRAAVSKGVKRLIDKDMIQVEVDQHDKRRQLLFLTNKAKEFEPTFRQILALIEGEIQADLSEEEVLMFSQLLTKVYNTLSSKLKNQCQHRR